MKWFLKGQGMGKGLISIGESIHASIRQTGEVMKELRESGAAAHSTPSEALDYIRGLVECQADGGAAYIAVNVDAFGEDDSAEAVDMMAQYVRLVRKWGKGVPICIDSSNDDVLIAGLKEWYDTGEPVKPPLINSIKVYTADRMMPLKEQYDFSFVGLLMTEDKPTGPGGSHSVEELVSLARELFTKAVNDHGFKAEEIFFDSTVFPLAIDMPMQPNVPGYTYRAFETIRAIKGDTEMKDCHCSLGLSNCCRDLPARKVGICRAYTLKAMEYGLDAAIVNVGHHLAEKGADPVLLEMVDAFAKMDGSAERTNEAMMQMGQYCAAAKKR